MFAYVLLWLGACSVNSGPVYFESGTYVLDSAHYDFLNEETDPEESNDDDMDSDYSAEKASFALEVDLENLTATITGTSYDATLTLKERPKQDWNDMCPMQLSTTDVQTVDIVEDLSLWGAVYQQAYLQSSECGGEERTTDTIAIGVDYSEELYLVKQ